LLTRRRIQLVCLGLLVASLAWHGWDLSPEGLLDRTGRLKCPDFLQFYTYGTLLRTGQAASLYDPDAHPLWASNTYGNPGSRMVVQDDGNVVIYRPDGTAVWATNTRQPIRILGVTSHFDVESFFGSVLVATFKTSDPANMKKFLSAYLDEIQGTADAKGRAVFDNEWGEEAAQIAAILKADPFGAKDIRPGELHTISPGDVKLDLQKLGAPDRGPSASGW